MAGKRVFGGVLANPNASTLSSLLHKQDSACSTSQPLHALFISPSSSVFLGSPSLMYFSLRELYITGSGYMVSFADTKGGKWEGRRSLFGRFGDDEIGEDGMEEYLQQPEKKRRLSAEQVQFLERTFEMRNKLEPDKKIQLAEDLNLQPRQVAIWFRNRRARWKTKQLEKDYESLEASFNSLKAKYDNLVKEKDRLKAEVANLKEKMLLREKTDKLQEKCVFDSASVKLEDMVSSAKSGMLEHCDSSYAFEAEADQCEESQDEQDNMNSSSLFPLCIFPRLEDVECSDPPESSCHPGFEGDDRAFWYWSY